MTEPGNPDVAPTFFLLTFPSSEAHDGWVAATPDVKPDGFGGTEGWGEDSGRAVAALRATIGEHLGVHPESFTFEPAGRQERRALRSEQRRLERGLSL